MSWTVTGVSAAPGLLDTYSGAAAAYSLRRLTWAYGGPVVRVRRSSDNTEQDFTATQVTDGTLTTFCGAGNGFVRTWYDQSGNGRNAAQTTTANQPQIVSSGSILLVNSKPALSFDGTNDLLTFSAFSASVYSNFAVIKKASTANSFISLALSTENGQSIGAWEDGNLYENNGSSFCYTTYTNNTLQGLFSVIKNGNTLSNYSARQNSTALGSYQGTAFTTISFGGIGARLSSSTYASGNMQEFILYATDQTASRATIESNINAYYAIY